MSCYGPLASWYDSLTGDIPYPEFADFYEQQFRSDGGEFHLLLDLCCGTGTLTNLMAERGYELIAVDASPDMLMQAQSKLPGSGTPPLYICQAAEELDLYGTVDACYCSLDGINYIPPENLSEVFRRLRLFIRPGGLFIFDIHPADWFRELDGEVFIDEQASVFCVWRADFDEAQNAITYGMDIFSRRGRLWERKKEEHTEYAHSTELLLHALAENGFTGTKVLTQCPQGDNGRIFITAVRA